MSSLHITLEHEGSVGESLSEQYTKSVCTPADVLITDLPPLQHSPHTTQSCSCSLVITAISQYYSSALANIKCH